MAKAKYFVAQVKTNYGDVHPQGFVGIYECHSLGVTRSEATLNEETGDYVETTSQEGSQIEVKARYWPTAQLKEQGIVSRPIVDLLSEHEEEQRGIFSFEMDDELQRVYDQAPGQPIDKRLATAEHYVRAHLLPTIGLMKRETAK